MRCETLGDVRNGRSKATRDIPEEVSSISPGVSDAPSVVLDPWKMEVS